MQIAAALLLLIPRTAAFGAFLCFPIILNFCILTFATRFDGSFFTAPLMVPANLYVIGRNYEKWKYVLPFNRLPISDVSMEQKKLNNQFPTLFFAVLKFLNADNNGLVVTLQ